MMITSLQGFILFAVIQTICAEFDEFEPDYPIDPSVPKECYGPPDNVHDKFGSKFHYIQIRGRIQRSRPIEKINLQECCPVDPLFLDRDLAKCGFKSPDQSRPWKSRDCSPRICIFKKYKLLYDNETVNYDAVGLFLDKWGETQTNIVEGVKQAKTICLGKKAGPPLPQKPFSNPHFIECEVDKLLICIRSNVIWNCNHNMRVPGCKKLSNHMNKCRQYLYKEIPTE